MVPNKIMEILQWGQIFIDKNNLIEINLLEMVFMGYKGKSENGFI